MHFASNLKMLRLHSGMQSLYASPWLLSRAHQTLYAAGIIPALAVLLCQSSDRASKAIPLKALNEMDKALDCDDWARAKKPLKDIASYVNGWDLLSNLSGEDDPDACDEITYCSIRLLHSVCKYASYDLSTMENAQRLLSLAQRSTSAAVIANAIGEYCHQWASCIQMPVKVVMMHRTMLSVLFQACVTPPLM